jgi:hypothetical protein
MFSSQASMVQTAKPWNMQNRSVLRIVVVGVQPTLVQRPVAARAAIVVVTVAMHNHHLAGELFGRIEAHAFPVEAGSAASQPKGRPVRRCATQTLVLLVCGGPAALGQVAKHATTGATGSIDNLGQSFLTCAEFLAPIVDVNGGR